MAELTIEQQQAVAIAEAKLKLARQRAIEDARQRITEPVETLGPAERSQTLPDPPKRSTEAITERYGLSEDEVKRIEDAWQEGFDSQKDKKPSWDERMIMNARQSFFANTVAGWGQKRKERGQGIANDIALKQKRIQDLYAELDRRKNGGFATNDYTEEQIDSIIQQDTQAIQELKPQLEAMEVEGLAKQARRAGEYAGMPEYKGALEGVAALSGQLAGGILTPETLTPGGAGKSVGWSLIRQGAANAAINALTNPLIQQGNIASGDQQDFSSTQFWTDVSVGVVAPAAMKAPFQLGKWFKNRGASDMQSQLLAEHVNQVKRSSGNAVVDDVASKKTKKHPSKFRVGAAKLVTPITDRLERIRPGLGKMLNTHAFQQGIMTAEGHRRAQPFLKLYKKFSKEDKKTFDRAVMSGPIAEQVQDVTRILNKYHAMDAYKAVRDMLDQYHVEAQKVGMDVGFIDDYWPRRIKDHAGLMDELHDMGADVTSSIERGLDAEAKKLDLGDWRQLDLDKQAELVNKVVRGHGPKGSQIYLGNFGQRKINEISERIQQYYEPAHRALLQYIDTTSKLIADRRFFGNSADKLDVSLDPDIMFTQWRNESIGKFIAQLQNEKRISKREEDQIKDMLSAYFNPKSTGPLVQIARDLTQALLLANPRAALTQVRDMQFSAYKNGAINTGQALRKRTLTREDLGLEKIGQEFSDLGKLAKYTNWLFKVSGFEKMDRMGKEVFTEANFLKQQKRASASADSAQYKSLIKDIQKIPALKDQAEEVAKAFRNGDRTNLDARLFLFDQLSEVQPITRAQMPQKYLEDPLSRILYTLQTFTIRQFNFMRKEIYDQITKPGTRKQGMMNLGKLASWYMLMGGSVEGVRDILFNREIEVGSTAADNLMEIVGANRWVMRGYTGKGPISGLAESKVYPAPMKVLVDTINAVERDIKDISEGEFELLKSNVVAKSPVIGPIVDAWWGKYAERKAKNN